MLIELSIENFKSIKESVRFSLLASSDKSNNNNLIETDALKKERLLKSAVLFGANAYGKTNFIEAFGVLKQLVLDSSHYVPGTKLNYQPFKLDPNYIDVPTKFEIIFIQNNIEYLYGLSYNSDKVIEEYLYYYPKGRKAKIFHRRNSSEFDKFTIDGKIQTSIKHRTSDNVLYLSNSAQQNYTKTREVFMWFKETLNVIGSTENVPERETVDLSKSEEYKQYIINAFLIADLGISDFEVSTRTIQTGEYTQSIPTNISLQNILNALPSPESTPKYIMRHITLENGKWYLKETDIKTLHHAKIGNGEQYEALFDYGEESAGTRKMFSLIGPWIKAFLSGQILVVDELDTHLHPQLTFYLINLFHDVTQNKKNAQLIFSTHNTNLLDQEIFRRDQIWFTNKNHDTGATCLYSLAEYKPRKDKNIQNGYLLGRYDAIPFISRKKILK